MKHLLSLAALSTAAALFAATPAFAEGETDAPTGDFDISATITGVTDYRFRGISLSDRDPAIQGSIDISHKSGIYAGVWASTIEEYAGADVEIDASLGWAGTVGPVDLDLGGLAYLYPSGSGVNYVELYGSVAHTIGPATLKAGVSYAPSQDNLGNTDNFYVLGEASFGIPNTPFTLKAGVGHEDGAFAGPTGKKWDWSLGVDYVKGPFTVGVQYVDTDISVVQDPSRNSRGGLLGSISFTF